MSAGGAAAGAAAAAAMQALKASGAVVLVEPDAFRRIIDRAEEPLVVRAPAGFVTNKHRYVISYKGLIFCTTSPIPIDLPRDCEVVEAKKIWAP
jgi:hypothetical protein